MAVTLSFPEGEVEMRLLLTTHSHQHATSHHITVQYFDSPDHTENLFGYF
jgi:hypothetical protein